MPQKPFQEMNCDVEGIFPPVAGILGSLQANEVLKTILNLEDDLNGNILIFDSLKMIMRKSKYKLIKTAQIYAKDNCCFFYFFQLWKCFFSSEEYFLTLRNEKVNLRQGPSFDYPVKIFYKKKNLPVLIQDSSNNFRKVRDHENNSGWIHISQLSKKKLQSLLKKS